MLALLYHRLLLALQDSTPTLSASRAGHDAVAALTSHPAAPLGLLELPRASQHRTMSGAGAGTLLPATDSSQVIAGQQLARQRQLTGQAEGRRGKGQGEAHGFQLHKLQRLHAAHHRLGKAGEQGGVLRGQRPRLG